MKLNSIRNKSVMINSCIYSSSVMILPLLIDKVMIQALSIGLVFMLLIRLSINRPLIKFSNVSLFTKILLLLKFLSWNNSILLKIIIRIIIISIIILICIVRHKFLKKYRSLLILSIQIISIIILTLIYDYFIINNINIIN